MTDIKRSAHLFRMRRWVRTPLIAVVAAGAVCTGVGIGSAAAETDFGDGVTAGRYSWNVTNATGKTVNWGQFCKVEVSTLPVPAPHSALEFGGTTPWAPLKPGERTADAFQNYPVSPVGLPVLTFNYTSGVVDIDDHLWTVKGDAPEVHPQWGRTTGASWHKVWIFWDTKTGTPFLANEGGRENIPLEPAVGDRHGKDNACDSTGG